MKVSEFQFFYGHWTINFMMANQQEGIEPTDMFFKSAEETFDFLEKQNIGYTDEVKGVIKAYFELPRIEKRLALYTDNNKVFLI